MRYVGADGEAIVIPCGEGELGDGEAGSRDGVDAAAGVRDGEEVLAGFFYGWTEGSEIW